jgi:hypothetical protein
MNAPRRRYQPTAPRVAPQVPQTQAAEPEPGNVRTARAYAEDLKAQAIPVQALGEVVAPRPGRVGVVMDIYTQNPGGAAKGFRVTASRDLEGMATAPSDRDDVFVTEEESVPLLAYTWVKPPGWFMVQNLTGTDITRRPTVQQQKAFAEAVVVIERPDQEKPVGYVRPGMPFCGEIPDPEECTMRCLAGTARLRVLVTPG